MIGFDPKLLKQYPRELLMERFSRRPGGAEWSARYDRGNGDITSWVPSSLHLQMIQKGWVCVDINPDSIPEADRELLANLR